MRVPRKRWLWLGLVGLVIGALAVVYVVTTAQARTSPTSYWPGASWRASTPEQQGMDSERLVDMFDTIRTEDFNLHSLLIVRHGYLVVEAYFYPYTPDTPHELRSCTKSILSVLVGIAIDQGAVAGVDQPVLDFFPERTIANLDARKRAIRVENLLTMTSGLDWQDAASETTSAMVSSANWVQYALDRPMRDDPGTRFKYNNGGAHLLAAILQQATGMTPTAFAEQNLFKPLGITDVAWAADPQGLSIGGWGMAMTPRDLAKIGYLYLQEGKWNNKQIVPADWIAASTQDHLGAGQIGYGYLWWVHPAEGLYMAEGSGGQYLVVVPELDMVVVFTGGTREDRGYSPPQMLLFDYIIPAAVSPTPLPENPDAADLLAKRIQARQQPLPKPVPVLPDTARRISGQTVVLAENSLGWRTLSLTFPDGADAALLTLDGALTLPVGLDRVFRVTQAESDTLALKGAWQDNATFTLYQHVVGIPEHLEIHLTFGKDTVEIGVKELVSGDSESFTGRAQP